ncbi:precorrin-3B synthase [Bradyrhizobium sp. CCGUVB1N3]|uniref:precorrin-3B synthase n=1 Tax=Bradyrhizobium sp. CCGUVB1N3 TaxID=2949629 RepID=UPI0020B35748|nr:precorrin-3B synthase [Bradyrhizobium sp. CCGUVB1N3]MCP3470864.1 precorrin-3B synthase [Bradyrhizobium sp. CCGUVB1N3]
MSAVAIKGWCPGALRPMLSGDGLVVRVRPHGGRLEAKQAAGIAELAARYGNGLIDVTSRANLQIRGVSDQGHLPVLNGLAQLGLLDPDPETESRRNILVTPFWNVGDESCLLAGDLEQALADGALDLPTKFGFAIDDGRERVLMGASADIRIERDGTGGLLLRADGAELGRSVTRGEVVSNVLALANWFVASGGAKGGRGRMATLIATGAKLPEGLRGDAEPAAVAVGPRPGLHPHGAMVGVAFGQLPHAALTHLASCAPALRMTPWRMILVEGAREMPGGEGFITEADDPALRVIACSGAPRCREAHADTRALAAALAPHIAPDARLHVSGCAKGCAHSGPAALTLVATRDGFDLVRFGSTRDMPVLRGLSGAEIVKDPSVLMGGR